ncbi:hypothetical protein C8R44DRAFT_890741 [Mycena epipterygia]|nr:hypothetical protein C8R44DRAFT_890741 [Mycena epipterygia]
MNNEIATFFVQRSAERMLEAVAHIARLQAEYTPERLLQATPNVVVNPMYEITYRVICEKLYYNSMRLEPHLPLICTLINDGPLLRRLVIWIQTAILNWELIRSGSTERRVDLSTIDTVIRDYRQMTASLAWILGHIEPADGPVNVGDPHYMFDIGNGAEGAAQNGVWAVEHQVTD